MKMLRTLKNRWRRMRRDTVSRITTPPHDPGCGPITAQAEAPSPASEPDNVHSIVAAITARHAELLATLQDHIHEMEAARAATQQQIDDLRSSLADTTEHQSATDNQFVQLGQQLDREQRRQLAQAEAARLRERRQDSRLNHSMLIAISALLSGVLASVLLYRDAHQTTGLLSQLSNDVTDIKASMGRQFGALHDPAPAADTASTGKLPDDPGVTPRANGRLSLPAMPGNAATGPDTPVGDDGHRTRQDMLAFFESNAARQGVITLADGLQYRVLSHGMGRTPGAGDLIAVDYSARLLDGTKLFDSQEESAPVMLNLSQLAPGLRETLPHMEEGSQWEVYVSPEIAYRGGTRNRKRFGNEPLVYVVELISIVESNNALQQQESE